MFNSVIGRIKRKVKESEADKLINTVKPYTLCDPQRIKSLINLSEYVNSRGIEGDFVECGTYKGGVSAVLSKYMGAGRRLHMYDSFEGLPETSEEDGLQAANWVGKCVGSVEDVKEVMRLVHTEDDKYVIRKGWFEQTFSGKLPNKVALLHCDADWYSSVMIVLDTFYPLMPEGGCIVLDDFGYWEGCREAFYDFCKKCGEKPLIERIGRSQAYWIKGKEHNRRH